MKKDDDIDVVSFDMDGTLIPRNFADDFWLKLIPEMYAERSDLSREKAEEELLKEYDGMGSDDIRWYQPEYWFAKYGFTEEPREVLEGYRKDYELYEDAVEVVERLSIDYELIIISNGIRMFIEVGLGGLKEYFSRLYSSVSDFKTSSKTPAIYRKVCDDIGVEPKRVVHVGDDLENDKIPAEEAGIRSYLLDREDRYDDGIKDLRELLEKL